MSALASHAARSIAVATIAGSEDPLGLEPDKLLPKRTVAQQHQRGTQRSRQPPERVDHDLRPLLAIQPPDIDQQRLLIADAQRLAQSRVALVPRKLAKLDAQRHDIDLGHAERAQLGCTAILAEREHRVEPAERAGRNSRS